MKKIVLAGNSLTANIISAHLRRDAHYQIVACAVDDEYKGCGGIEGLPTLSLSELKETHSSGDISIVMAMGYADLNKNRQRMFDRLKGLGYFIETYIHPTASVHSKDQLGEGALVFAGAVIEPGAQVGRNTFVWAGAVVAHDSRVGDHCWIAANAVVSGQAGVGNNTFIGVNATIANKVTVGECNIIGAAALITKNTKPRSVLLTRSAELFRASSEDYVKYFGF